MKFAIGLLIGFAFQVFWMDLCDRRGWHSFFAQALGIPIVGVLSVLAYLSYAWMVRS